MTLQRVAIPSPNYSSRGGSAVRLIVIHTAQGASTKEDLGAYFQGNVEASSHTGIDDELGVIATYVERAQKSWTQANANPYCVSTELCAWAEWSTAEWHGHPNILSNVAQWVAEEAAAFGIPIIGLNAGQAQGGASGVCQHVDLGSAGGGHWDAGPGFPMSEVLAMAGGQAPSTPSPQPPSPSAPAGPAPTLHVDYFGIDHNSTHSDVGVWQAQMSARGWSIGVDSIFGPQSEDVARSFQSEKGLAADGLVGPDTWSASWTAPVT
jgi:hypothetical protein